MPKIRQERVTAEVKDDFVVFLIGIRINRIWNLGKWMPVFFAMPKMLKELSAQSDLGLLGSRTRWGGRNIEVIQYWRSFDDLHAYARSREGEHLPAWAAFNRKISDNGTVGIWHETYLVRSDQCESVYRNMPDYGLAAATRIVPATKGRKTAAGRLGKTDTNDPLVNEAGEIVSNPATRDDQA